MIITAAEGAFPKIDGDKFYASEINSFFGSYADVKTFNLAVTNSTSTVDLSGTDYKYTMIIRNIGYVDCFFDLDNSCATTCQFLPAGAEVTLNNCSFQNVSAITTSGTTTLSIAVFTGYADKIGYKTNKEILILSATQASSEDSFTDTTLFKDILITNEGPYEVYIAFGATAATTDFRLEPRESLVVNTVKYQIAAICNTGETATVSILGVY